MLETESGANHSVASHIPGSGVNAGLPAQELIHELFELQAEKTPDNIALIFEGQQLSYRELNQAANQLARHLRRQGVMTETLVGICLERGPAMVTAMLAVLKAGGACLALAPDERPERMAYMLDELGLHYLVTESAVQAVAPGRDIKVVAPEEEKQQIQMHPATNLERDTGQLTSSLAYVTYTSGRRGLPKAVMVEHQAFINSLSGLQQQLAGGSTQSSRQLCVTPFDDAMAVLDIFGGLARGAALVLADKTCASDPGRLSRLIEQHDINFIQATQATWQLMLESGWPGKGDLLVLTGGVLSLPLARFLLSRCAQVWHCYGAPEAGLCSLVRPLVADADPLHQLALGAPLANSRYWILDGELQAVTQGKIGELYLGGATLARGYCNPGPFKHRDFIRVPLNGEGKECLFKTGDLVRYLADGRLEYLGAVREQVTLRGSRVELAELEALLMQDGKVSRAVARVQPSAQGDEQLQVYLCPPSGELARYSSPEDKAQGLKHSAELIDRLRQVLMQRLPEFMLPDAYFLVAEMPLTPQGEIDQAALAGVEVLNWQHDAGAQTEHEKALVEIWADLLRIRPEALGVTGNFFALGGDSLLAMRLAAKIHARWQQVLSLSTLFEAPTIRAQAQAIAKGAGTPLTAATESQARQGGAVLPASPAQQALWLKGPAVANTVAAYAIAGNLDPDAVEQALAGIILCHGALRTVFRGKPGQLEQVLLADAAFTLERHDLAGEGDGQRRARVDALMARESAHVFDLKKDLLIRAIHVRHAGTQAAAHDVLLLNLHPMAADTWSLGILRDELIRRYQAIVRGEQTQPAAPALQYADYALWQRQWLQGQESRLHLDYWLKLLNDAPACHRLPLDRARGKPLRENAVVTGELSAALTARVTQLLEQKASTLFMFMQAALAVHIGRLSHETDVVLGGVNAGRGRAGLASLIGLVADTRVYRTRFADNPGFDELLARTRQEHLTALPYADVPFSAIVAEIKPSAKASYAPVFQVAVNLVAKEELAVRIDGLAMKPLAGNQAPDNQYDISLYIEEPAQTHTCLRFKWVYDAGIFDAPTVTMFAREFEYFIRQILDKPGLPVLDHGWQTSGQSAAVLPDKGHFGRDSIASLFEQQARTNPEATALSYGRQSWSYQALNQKVNRLCHLLAQDYQVSAGDRVLVATLRNEWHIIAVLALHKLGACYIPLSDELPRDRMKYMLGASEPDIILTDEGFSQRHAWLTPGQTAAEAGGGHKDRKIVLDGPAATRAQAQHGQENPPARQVPETAIANILFTSGSTGNPKGVLGSYEATDNRINWMLDALPFSVGEAMTHITDMAFVGAIWEMLVPLCGGGHLLLCPRDLVRQADKFLDFLIEQKVTRLKSAPSLMKALCEVPRAQDCQVKTSIEHWFIGADLLTIKDAHLALAKFPGICLYNMYGSTEVMSDALWARVSLQDQGIYAPVGYPLAGMEVMVTGSGGQRVPDGVIGELVVVGWPVAKGYLGDDSGQSFIQTPAGRGYRTGDLGWIGKDGQFQCIGRMDDQIKIRGYRIELGEIAHQIALLEQVASSLVLAREQETGEKVLTAYVVPEKGTALGEQAFISLIKTAVADFLPDYMLPSSFVILPHWPLTPLGKIDRKALPAPKTGLAPGQYLAPETETEKALVAIWGQLLNLEAAAISVTVGFFDLGGHSLLAVRMVAAIRERLGAEIAIGELFDLATIRQLAPLVDKAATMQFVQDQQQNIEITSEGFL
ncbi:AMP-binding protein [Thalassomonas viridans]|uniref:AMP-binding protein n=1 Tax=Thalassomonas viridans TaxID=137584 RepID=A0AAE9ZC91_9GAMM|nr:AMP-binding protein [Thalassomonas viridans]WDE09259.1 AMP-binding protein [Thalassomonas viridans]